MKLISKHRVIYLILLLTLNISGCSKIEKLHSEVKSSNTDSHYPVTITTYTHMEKIL